MHRTPRERSQHEHVECALQHVHRLCHMRLPIPSMGNIDHERGVVKSGASTRLLRTVTRPRDATTWRWWPQAKVLSHGAKKDCSRRFSPDAHGASSDGNPFAPNGMRSLARQPYRRPRVGNKPCTHFCDSRTVQHAADAIERIAVRAW